MDNKNTIVEKCPHCGKRIACPHCGKELPVDPEPVRWVPWNPPLYWYSSGCTVSTHWTSK